MSGVRKSVALLLVLVFTVFTVYGCRKNENPEGKTTTKQSAYSSEITQSTTKSTLGSTGKSTQTATKTAGTTMSDSPDDAAQGDASSDYTQPDIIEPGEENKPEEISEDIVDLQGRTIVFAATYDEPCAEDTGRLLAQYQSFQYNAEKYNFNYQWIKDTQGNIKNNVINSVVSGVHYTDVMLTNRKAAYPELVSGPTPVLLQLDKYFDFEGNELWNDKTYAEWKGKHYGFHQVVYYAGGTGIWYHRDMLYKEGVKEPYDYFEEGRWDWDALLEIAVACTKDTDGDGILDQFGISYNTESGLFSAFIYNNGGDMFRTDSNDNIIFTGDDVINRRAIQFVDALFNYYKVMVKGGYNTGIAAMHQNQHNAGASLKNSMTNQGFIIFPKGPDVDEYVTYRLGSGAFWAIPSTIDNPEIMVPVILDMNCYWDPSKPYYFSEDDQQLDLAQQRLFDMRDFKFLQMSFANSALPSGKIPMISIVQITEIGNLIQKELFDPLVSGAGSVLASIDKVKPAIQAELDKYNY